MVKSDSGSLTKKLMTAMTIVCITMIAVYIAAALGKADITASTVKREALPAGSVNETAYYTENPFLNDSFVIEKGLKHFYDRTGVQPYVYLTTSIDGSSNCSYRNMVAYARPLYNQLFTDESHLLLVFLYDYQWGDYDCCVVSGADSKKVIDSEAENILSDYIDRSFNDSGLSTDFNEIFSNAFSGAADRIMSITPWSWAPILTAAGAVFILASVLLRRRYLKLKAIKERQSEEMLKMPLEKYGKDAGH